MFAITAWPLYEKSREFWGQLSPHWNHWNDEELTTILKLLKQITFCLITYFKLSDLSF